MEQQDQVQLAQMEQTIAALRQERDTLAEQVKRLLKVEREMGNFQQELGAQMRIHRQLYELGQTLQATFEQNEILTAIVNFVLYELNFERCMVLLDTDESQVLRVCALDGYYDAEERQAMAEVTVSLDEPALAPLLLGAEHLLCPELCEHERLLEWGQAVGIDEFVAFPLRRDSARLLGLLVAGNTTDMAHFQTRIEAGSRALIGLANLVNQATTALLSAALYHALEEERRGLALKVEQRTAELERMQQERLRELSTPLIPLSEHVLLMPLIGSLDSGRVQQVMETLLEGVAYYQSEVAILDITGVAVVDTQVADGLVLTARAVRLLGARVVLTGIRPDVARTLVSLGITLEGVVARRTVQGGVAYALGG